MWTKLWTEKGEGILRMSSPPTVFAWDCQSARPIASETGMDSISP